MTMPNGNNIKRKSLAQISTEGACPFQSNIGNRFGVKKKIS